MKTLFKKILAITLCFLMCVTVFVPSLAVEDEEYPIVLLGGFGDALVNAEGEQIYPTGIDLGDYLDKVLPSCTEQLLRAYMTDEWTDYADEFTKAVLGIFEGFQVSGEGVVTDGSHAKFSWTTDTLLKKTSGYEMEDYFFEYDWRVSCYDIADKLAEYIDDVLEVTGEKKVNLVGRCLGVNIALCYFEVYGTDKINTFVSHVGGPEGNGFVSAMFKGDFCFDEEGADNFATSYLNNYGLLDDPAMDSLLGAFVSLINDVKLLGLGTGAIEEIYSHIKVDAMPDLIRHSFGSFAAIWDCVLPEAYEQAKDFVFNTPELKEEYAGMLAKTDRYNYTIKNNVRELLKKYSEEINIEVIAKYNSDNYPFFEDCNVQSDGLVEVELSSYGATTVNMGETLSDSYIKERTQEGFGKYISKDKIIDASTCLFPEHTWFFRDIEHRNWAKSIDDVITQIIRSNGEMTVEDYPQFSLYDYDSGELVPVMGVISATDDRWNAGFESVVIKFIMRLVAALPSIFNMILALFK